MASELGYTITATTKASIIEEILTQQAAEADTPGEEDPSPETPSENDPADPQEP